MAIRDRIKRVIAAGRRRSSVTTNSQSSSTSSSSSKHPSSSDRSSSIYYQPGEKIPYKYRRPVEPTHQKNLDSFRFADAWRSKSVASQYSPMGSRMPSRQNSLVRAALGGRLSYGGSRAAGQDDESSTTNLTPIESVPITRMEPSDPTEATLEPFSQTELDKALQKANSQSTVS